MGSNVDGTIKDTQTVNIDDVKKDEDKIIHDDPKKDEVPTIGVKGRASEKMKDVDQKAWYREYVDYVVENGIMKGVSDDMFGPEVTTSRAMIVTILYALEGRPAMSETSSFNDVEAGSWYANAVAWAVANNIVSGYGDGMFGPSDDITREQFMAIMYKYAVFKGMDISDDADISAYDDQSAVSGWATASVKWAISKGLISGRTETTIAPGEEAIRAEAAVVFMKFIESL